VDADRALIAALLAGDEAVFAALVDRLHARIVRVCRRFVASDAAAEDAAQDTWQGVLEGLCTFQGRCALDTWILQIAINRAKSRGARDARARHVDDSDTWAETVRFDTFGSWKDPPQASLADCSPETAASNRELVRLVTAALDDLPEQQRLVVTLRDVELLSAAEVCEVLELSEENQRVLLHRGRARLRAQLEQALVVPCAAHVLA
jgi:RNA polymerase sigma-70 factor (ECF subfamily)